MASFERKSMETIVQSMVDWTRGVTTKITDFRVGSKIRTIQESVALVVEELYDKVYRNTKVLIEENIYTVMGFSKRQATYATGKVTFSRTTPADADYLISSGTIVKSKATATTPPIQYRTTADVLMATGTTSVDAPVVCLTAGKIGNVEANSITDFVTKPSGIDAVTNQTAFSNALDQETQDEQKVRFQKYIQSLSRGTLQAIEYGALTAEILDDNGLPTERVISSKAFEYLPARKGEVDVYIWNGVGPASTNLINKVQTILNGYYDSQGQPVYGYKPAGIVVTVYSATVKNVTIRLLITPEDGTTLDSLKPFIERQIDDYFASLQLGETLIQSALEAQIKFISGVKDVRLDLSTDGGTTFNQNNITTGPTEILLAVKPIQYA
jgi:uncharacterized phage protein gp47/JayE